MSTPNQEERQRIVDASLNIIKKNNPQLLTPAPKDELDQLMEKVEQVTKRVRQQYAPILTTLKETGADINPKQCLVQLHRFYIDEFRTFNKDEMVFICALVHANLMKDQIV